MLAQAALIDMLVRLLLISGLAYRPYWSAALHQRQQCRLPCALHLQEEEEKEERQAEEAAAQAAHACPGGCSVRRRAEEEAQAGAQQAGHRHGEELEAKCQQAVGCRTASGALAGMVATGIQHTGHEGQHCVLLELHEWQCNCSALSQSASIILSSLCWSLWQAAATRMHPCHGSQRIMVGRALKNAAFPAARSMQLCMRGCMHTVHQRLSIHLFLVCFDTMRQKS